MSKSKHFEPIFNIQISRNVGRWGNPLGITQSFFPQQRICLIYEKEPDESGQDFFVRTIWYKDGVYDGGGITRENGRSRWGGIGTAYDEPSKGKVDVYVSS